MIYNWTKATDDYISSDQFESEEIKIKRRGNHKKRIKIKPQKHHTWGTIGIFTKRCTNCGATMDLTMRTIKYRTKRGGGATNIIPKCSYKGL